MRFGPFCLASPSLHFCCSPYFSALFQPFLCGIVALSSCSLRVVWPGSHSHPLLPIDSSRTGFFLISQATSPFTASCRWISPTAQRLLSLTTDQGLCLPVSPLWR